jgi:hypothetical protein
VKALKRKTPRIILLPLLSLLASVVWASLAAAQSPQSPDDFKPVTFKLPKGYMPGPFPEKRAGQVLLDAKRPAGMYILYPKADETPEALTDSLKAMVADMFLHDSKTKLTWTEATLPSHKGVGNESGTLYSASDGEADIQLAAYTRTVGPTKVAYGYYAMRRKGGRGKSDGVLLDGAGAGVKAFDEFCESISESK